MAQSTDPVISTIWKNKDIEPLGQYPPVSDFIFIELFLCSNCNDSTFDEVSISL